MAPSTSQRIAVIDPARCLAWGGSACQTCYLQCPLREEAIVLDDGRPLIMASVCNGCGVCVEACRAVNDLGAIGLVARLTEPARSLLARKCRAPLGARLTTETTTPSLPTYPR